MILTDFERNHALWKKISEHLEERIQTLRVRNDGFLNEIETAHLRGRIASLKELLALGETRPDPVADE